MCEYQRIEENKPPTCEHTKDLCTYCVLGNANKYKEAEQALKERENNERQRDCKGFGYFG